MFKGIRLAWQLQREQQRRIQEIPECPKCFYHRGFSDWLKWSLKWFWFSLFFFAVAQQMTSQYLSGYFFALGASSALPSDFLLTDDVGPPSRP